MNSLLLKKVILPHGQDPNTYSNYDYQQQMYSIFPASYFIQSVSVIKCKFANEM